MNKALVDLAEMQIIYNAAKDVYDGKCTIKYALFSLKNKVTRPESSLKMYFNIYSCMRNGKCYKLGTSKSFTYFLIVNIFKDFGVDAFKTALSAAKGNSLYREIVNNAQPGIERACRDAIRDCGVEIMYEDIPTPTISSFKKVDIHRTSVDLDDSNSIKEENRSATFDDFKFDYAATTEKEDEFELNIQPAASILNVFSRLSYKPWYALAEFVDNSTQSYISHADILDKVPEFDKLVVSIRYNTVNNTLTISDNAYGMEFDRFRDAILLDSRNDTQSGRNEFGMGLKTAASWFGNVWRVTSTQYGSINRYSATVDIPKLKEYSMNSVRIRRDYVSEATHGTEVVIEQVTKKITGPRTIVKIRDLLSSMYRRDINSRNIEIWFNDEPIVFEDYPILMNFRDKRWRKELDFDISFGGNIYRVTGFVAIMNPGSFPKSGFALFRQDRVIVGGTDNNYKPSQIFGQVQSQRSLKLFGELNMNDFPVNQAKDGFIWDDGLEDVFVSTLKDNIQEYIEIAEMSIKERASETQYSKQASTELQQDIAKVLSNAFSNNNEDDDSYVNNEYGIDKDFSEESNNDIREYIDTVLNEEIPEEKVGTIRNYNVNISHLISVEFNVQWAIGNKTFWINYVETSTDVYDVVISIDHPFFVPFSKDEAFKRVLEKFALSFILAERQAKLASDKQGYISTNVIKNYMNQYLKALAEDK